MLVYFMIALFTTRIYIPRSLSTLHGFLFHVLSITCQTKFYLEKTDQSEIGEKDAVRFRPTIVQQVRWNSTRLSWQVHWYQWLSFSLNINHASQECSSVSKFYLNCPHEKANRGLLLISAVATVKKFIPDVYLPFTENVLADIILIIFQ